MAIIKTVRGFTPKIGNNVFLADNAVVVGDVEIGDDSSVWYSAVLRGDVNTIKIGSKVNIQDGAVLHTLYQKSTIEIGNNVSIGHNVCIHGAKIEDNVLIGIGATVLDHAVIGSNSIIAANSLVLTGTIVEPGSIYAGVPAKKVKDVEPHQTREMINKIADNYLMYASWYKEKKKKKNNKTKA
jgi:carbonic anhydrase/acetyltransferase-like protein (isoleucine patch superfamily)